MKYLNLKVFRELMSISQALWLKINHKLKFFVELVMQKFEDLIDIFADTLLFPLVFKNNFDILFSFFFFFLIILFTKWQYRKIDWNNVLYFHKTLSRLHIKSSLLLNRILSITLDKLFINLCLSATVNPSKTNHFVSFLYWLGVAEPLINNVRNTIAKVYEIANYKEFNCMFS